MIKLVIFDMSDVTTTNEETPYVDRYARDHNLDPREFSEYYLSILPRAEIGEITGHDVWRELLAKFGIKDDVDRIVREMASGKDVVQEVLDFAKALRSKVKTAFLTNYSKAYWDAIIERLDFKPYFDYGLVSYQIKARKPAEEGFRHILDHFNVKPEEAVYTDDNPKNFVNPEKLGMHTIAFKNKDQLQQELEKLGVFI